MSKPEFTDILDDYLDERDRQNSNYYLNRFYGEREDGKYKMETLRKELNALIHGNHNEQTENQ